MTDPRLDAERGPVVRFTFDGTSVKAHEGETIAAALWAHGVRAVRTSGASPRGIYCNMGICFECLVRIDGRAVRACKCENRRRARGGK